MRHEYSMRLREDVNSAVQKAFKTTGIVNITAVAECVRVSNLAENVALEDIEHLVLQAAQLLGAAIEFDGAGAGTSLLDNDIMQGSDETAIASAGVHQPMSIQ